MEIGASTLLNRELAVNHGNIRQDTLQKSQEKVEETKQLQQTDKPETVRKPEGDKQSRIDFYA